MILLVNHVYQISIIGNMQEEKIHGYQTDLDIRLKSFTKRDY